MSRWIITFLFVFAVPTLATAQAKKKPNIIVIMSDDHANAAIGAYNFWLKPAVKTPNLDKLAKQGMLFKNSLVTNSICTPCRAAILTSQYSHKNGVYTLADALDKSRVHIAHLLRMLGYQTALIGKWHLAIDPTPDPPAEAGNHRRPDGRVQRPLLQAFPFPNSRKGQAASLPGDFAAVRHR